MPPPVAHEEQSGESFEPRSQKADGVPSLLQMFSPHGATAVGGSLQVKVPTKLLHPKPLQKQELLLESSSLTAMPPQLILSSHRMWIHADPLNEITESLQVFVAHCSSALPALKDIRLSSQGCAKGSLGLPHRGIGCSEIHLRRS